MYFQVNVSPVAKTNSKKPLGNDTFEVAVLTLAPFTRKPQIIFDNIKVKTVGHRELIVKNPTTQDIELYITHSAPEIRKLQLSWYHQIIPSNNQVVLELQWSPNLEGKWSDTITFENGHRLKKDVTVIFKSVCPKKQRKKPNRSGCIVVSKKIKNLTFRKISPTKNANTSLVKPSPTKMSKHVLPDITNIPTFTIDSPMSYNGINELEEAERRRGTFTIKDKENFNMSRYTSMCSPPLNSTFKINKQDCNQRDILKSGERKKLDMLNFKTGIEEFDDSLETVSSVSTDITKFNRSNQMVNKVSVTPSMEEKLKAVVFSPIIQLATEEELINVCNINSNKSTPNTKHDINTDTFIHSTNNSNHFLHNMFEPLHTSNGEGANIVNLSGAKSSTPRIFNKQITLSPVYSDIAIYSSTELIEDRIETDLLYVHSKPILHQIIEESYVSDSEVDVSLRKRKSNTILKLSKPKRLILESKKSSKFLPRTANKTPFKEVTSLSLNKFVKSTNSVNFEEKSVILHDPDTFINVAREPFILTATNSIDPFMSSSLYYDLKWVEDQEVSFKKWLNALLMPPSYLSSVTDQPVDVVKVWQQCKKQEVSKAPTKELVSTNLYITNRLDSLRRSSVHLFRSTLINQVLSKTSMMVENQKIFIRNDRNVHLDLGLQAEVMSLFLSYNPLWLRIGLETIYGVTIPLQSNSDVMGLSLFISEHFFKDSYLLKKYKTVHSEKYAIQIKKKILNKFLMFVYFLDQGKLNKLVSHDPCLFCKHAPVKESREILLKFSMELISAIGDITKFLKCTGYELSHKQTYIHEFDYTVSNLGSDLKDGVRLTRLTEIILMENGLVNALRVPAISRLQKIHNMKIVFSALHKAGFEILYDILPKDIVEGHKEKTLSFLWQIIYKFQAPRFKKAAITIQTWWRSPQILVKKRVLIRRRIRRELAATKIQKWFKRTIFIIKLQKFVPLLRRHIKLQLTVRAVIKIQSYIKMKLQRKRYLHIRKTITKLQCYGRRFLTAQKILQKRAAIISIQTFIRMYLARSRYLKIKTTVLKLEECYVTKRIRERYLQIKNATIVIQKYYRSTNLARIERINYLKLKNAVLYIQMKYRAYIAMKSAKESYVNLKLATVSIQSCFRANVLTRKERTRYIHMKMSSIKIQRWYREKKFAQTERMNYVNLRNAVLKVQKLYRAKKCMEKHRDYFNKLKQAVLLVQHQYRANCAMNIQLLYYRNLKSTVIYVQRQFKANLVMRYTRNYYLNLKLATIFIQTRFRAKSIMRKERLNYIIVRKSAIKIQQWYRAVKLSQKQRFQYLSLLNTILYVQKRYRAKQMMEKQRNHYNILRQAVLFVQNRYRAKQAMTAQYSYYQALKFSVVHLQRKFRATKAMRLSRNHYLNLKLATISIQSRFKANLEMHRDRQHYKLITSSVITIQRWYRATKLLQKQRNEYKNLHNAVTCVQKLYRAKKNMEKQRDFYQKLKRTVKFTENRYLANKLMKIKQSEFQNLKRSCLCIQKIFRANCLMKRERKTYQNTKTAIVLIQTWYRATMLMKTHSTNYKKLKMYTNVIQRRFRNNRRQKMINAAIIIQKWYKTMKLVKIEQNNFKTYLQAVKIIQMRYRAFKLMKIEQNNYWTLRRITINIQRRYRSIVIMKRQYRYYHELKKYVQVIQTRYKANKLRDVEQIRYQKLRVSAIVVQKYFRSYLKMKEDYKIYKFKLQMIVKIQTFSRSYLMRKLYKEKFEPILQERRKVRNLRKCAVTKIQSAWRGYQTRSKEDIIIRNIRVKVKKANENAVPEKTLGFRKRKALQHLLSEDPTLLQIIRSLRDLDYVTRRCKATCKTMGKELPEDLYKLIRSTSRSLPEMETCTLATSILINFSKFDLTSCWYPKYIDKMFTVMVHWCDKEGFLFLYLCTLIWLFAHNEMYKMSIQKIPNIRQRLEKMKQLCTRKQNMVARSSHKYNSIFVTYTNLNLPSRDPDWGIDYQCRPRTFNNALHSLNSIFTILDVEL